MKRRQLEEFRGVKPGTVEKILRTEEELARLRLLVKVYGFCHPDIQVARLTEEQAHERLRETMTRESDPRMPNFKPSE
jgi:hypothetical protein